MQNIIIIITLAWKF